MDKLIVGADYVKMLWVPDTFFVNEKVASFHQATQVHKSYNSQIVPTDNIKSEIY